MNARLEAIISDARNAWSREMSSGKVRLTVVIDTSSLARGAQETLDAINTEVATRHLNADVAIAGSWGFNWMEPCIAVRNASGTETVLYGNITADRVADFLQAVVVEGRHIPDWAIGISEGTSTVDIPALSDHPFMQGQVRRLMANLGLTDPENIEHYLAHEGYVGFGKALELDAEAIVKEMVDSGLGGRAGGGFPAGRKWDFLRTATTHPRYLICNADEGDPGAWVNRILLEGDPHLIVEGMLIASLATEADAGYIYIRYEYPLAYKRLQVAVKQAYEKGLLGTNILGTGKNFEIIVHRGAGSYVCGDETGLINSIDSYRGMPRIKPPFPAQAGLWNKPTNVNNVESYANAPMILRNGAEWWAGVSDAKEKGTKMFTFSGPINTPGCVEIPFGPTARHALEQWGGGLNSGRPLKGYQPGGPLSGILPATDIDFTLTLDPFRGRGMFLGGGGIVFFDDSTCIVDFCTYFLAFCESESCGRCTTCRNGSQRAVEIVRRIQYGGGRDSDFANLTELCSTLRWSNCLHGQSLMTCIKTTLEHFRAEWVEHIEEKKCRAGVCSGLIQYAVKSQSDANLPDAVEICPTNAIQGSPGSYAVVDSLCIRCGACKEVAPGAMEVRHRFLLEVSEGAAAAAAG